MPSTLHSNNGFHFDDNRFHAKPRTERNYIVEELATNQLYQGLLLTKHYLKCFYKIADRINNFLKYCSSHEEFSAFQSMAIPEGTKIVCDDKLNLIFLLLPEYGESFHTTYAIMTMEEKAIVIKKVIKFMKICHKVNLFFRDCKLQKFVQRSKQCDSTDIRLHNPFELFLSNSPIVKGRHRFTPFWAPEMFSRPEEYDGAATDVWSFGVFIYRTFVGKYPFVDADPQGFMTKVRNCQYGPFPDNVIDVEKQLVRLTLTANPNERPTVNDLDRWIDNNLINDCSICM